MNSNIFRAYDIRGIYPRELDENFAYLLGRAFVVWLSKQTAKEGISLIVSRDMRLSSPALHKALLKGLLEQGSKVIDIGLAATPTFYFAVGDGNFDGGIQISASHNPKEYNGFKIVREKAEAVGREQGGLEIARLMEGALPKNSQGMLTEKPDALEKQIEHDLKFIDINVLKSFKVVADPANSMGTLYLEALFKKIPSKLVKMNFELDGSFPAHPPDPLNEKNLVDLQKKVIEEKADLGIATDGDGDRIFFVDERGEIVPPAILRGLLAQLFLKDRPGAKICYDIRPGRITYEMIKEAGGVPVLTRVGHSFIKQKMREEGAYFGGESSGHYFLNLPSGIYEIPVIVILKILELISQKGEPLSQIIAPYKKYFHSGEINRKVKDKEAVMRKIEEIYSSPSANSGHQVLKIDHLDGISVEYPDFWFNVRPSNTEPLLRLNLEAISKELMEKKRDEILALMEE